MQALLIGNLTLDENIIDGKKYSGPGGSVYFIAKTLGKFDVNSNILSAYGKDFPRNYISKIRLIPRAPTYEKTLRFKNIYSGGKRKQTAENYERLDFSTFRQLADRSKNNNPNIIIIAPVINNISNKLIRRIREKYPHGFFVLLPQGFFRRIGKDNKIIKDRWENSFEIISLFDFISFSDEDINEAEELARQWSKKGPIVAVTRAEKGANFYFNGNKIETKAEKIEEIGDPTGAGDVFAASFSYYYLTSHNLNRSAESAHKSAAQSLREKSNNIQYSLKGD